MHQVAKCFHVAWGYRWAACLLGAVLLLVYTHQYGWAHKVTIFAWVEGETVHTQSKFSGGKKAKNSTVAVLDPDGNQLLEGKTDDNGEFSFKVPQQTDLRVVLKASMGHLGEWIIPAEELAGNGMPITPNQGVPTVSVSTDADQKERFADKKAPTVQPEIGMNREEIAKLVEDVLDKKLTPIMNLLAEAQEKGPTLEKIISGIGYIFGIVGVAFYFSGRSRKK